MTECTTTISPRAHHICLRPHINLHTNILPHTLKQNPSKSTSYNSSLLHPYIRRSLPDGHSPTQENVFHDLHKTYQGYIVFSDNMPGWSSVFIDIPSVWGTKDT